MYVHTLHRMIQALLVGVLGPLVLLSFSSQAQIGTESKNQSGLETEILPTYGWLENIMIYPPGMKLSAKLDTGADSCSIHAEDMTRFKKGKKDWIAFTLSNRYGESAKVARKVVRITKIKTKRGGAQKRPVVRFGICVGEVYEVVDCNLVNRAHFQYPVLVGRNMLAGSALVDSSSTFSVEPNCQGVRPPK